MIRHTRHLLRGDDDMMMIMTCNSIIYEGSGVLMISVNREEEIKIMIHLFPLQWPNPFFVCDEFIDEL